MPGSFQMGKIAGIRIEINVSWLIILVLLTASLATGWFPHAVPGLSTGVYWITSLVAAILLFLSVLAHELGHSVLARARGLPVRSITLFIFGGVSDLEQEPRSAGVEFFVAVIGPLISLIVAAITWLPGQAIGSSSPLVASVLLYLGLTNFLLAVFNMLPGFPLDGGRVLRSILWGITGNLRTATRWAAGVGQFFAVLLILWGIWQFFLGSLLTGVWIGFIGWFLLNAAQTANTQVMLETVLRGFTVRDVMSPVTLTVPEDMSLRELVDEHILPLGLRYAPVVRQGQLLGLITLHGIRNVSRDRWADVLVGHVMLPLERLHVTRPDQPLSEVLTLMARQDVNQLPVVDGGRLVGVLSRAAVVRFLEVRRGLGLQEMRSSGQQHMPSGGRPPDDVNAPMPT